MRSNGPSTIPAVGKVTCAAYIRHVLSDSKKYETGQDAKIETFGFMQFSYDGGTLTRAGGSLCF